MSVRLSETWRLHHPVNIRHLGTGRTMGERIADGVAARVGSWTFIITQTLLLGAWIVANVFLFRGWVGVNRSTRVHSSFSTSCSRSKRRTPDR
jgi:uncharacterized membrane protein